MNAEEEGRHGLEGFGGSFLRVVRSIGLIGVNPTESDQIQPKWVASDLCKEGREATKGLRGAESPIRFVLPSFCVFPRLLLIIILGWI